MEKLPDRMTAPLNEAQDCCDPEVDGQMAGLTGSHKDAFVAVPAITSLRTLDICICYFVESSM